MQTLEYKNKDLYQIEKYDGEKQVHIMGYIYDEGEPGEDDPKATSRCVDYCNVFIPLKKFVEIKKSDPEHFRQKITEIASEYKQYIADMTPAEARQTVMTYYAGDPPVVMSYNKINMKTPIGEYIDE